MLHCMFHEGTNTGGAGRDGTGTGGQINSALAANDRIKYYFALLQVAVTQGEGQAAPTLRQERLACGIDDSTLDDVVRATRREGDCYRMPGCAKLLRRVAQELQTMAAPVFAEEALEAAVGAGQAAGSVAAGPCESGRRPD